MCTLNVFQQIMRQWIKSDLEYLSMLLLQNPVKNVNCNQKHPYKNRHPQLNFTVGDITGNQQKILSAMQSTRRLCRYFNIF